MGKTGQGYHTGDREKIRATLDQMAKEGMVSYFTMPRDVARAFKEAFKEAWKPGMLAQVSGKKGLLERKKLELGLFDPRLVDLTDEQVDLVVRYRGFRLKIEAFIEQQGGTEQSLELCKTVLRLAAEAGGLKELLHAIDPSELLPRKPLPRKLLPTNPKPKPKPKPTEPKPPKPKSKLPLTRRKVCEKRPS